MLIHLEPYIWESIEEIARREMISVSSIGEAIRERLRVRQDQHGDISDLAGSVSSALRVLAVSYFRRDGSYSRIADALDAIGPGTGEVHGR